MKYIHFSVQPTVHLTTFLLCLLTSLLCLASCRDSGPNPEVTLADSTPAGNGTIQAETYASSESRAQEEDTPPDSDHATSSTSGRLSSASGTSLNLIVDWVRTPGQNADSLTVTVRLTSYRLSVGERPGLGRLSVGGEAVSFSTEPICITDNSNPTLTDLYTHTFSVPSGQTVPLSASWPFNGTYAGVELGSLSVQGSIS